MPKINKIKSNIIGLDMGLVIGRFFLNTEDLHFGYWPSGEKPTVQNFSWAQENHTSLIMDNIPKGTKRILDVGSGSGNLALKLLNAGYLVDCVIPSEYLANAVNEKLKGRGQIYICKFEDFNCKNQYDLILFSESFQYVQLKKSLQLLDKILSTNGYLIICDFFKLDVPGKSLMGGGHKWQDFQVAIENTTLQKITDLDITDGTAPTIDFLDNFSNEVLKPMSEMIGQYMLSNYPKLTKMIMWKFRPRFNKIKQRYFSGIVNGENFKKYKTYRLLLYRLIK